MIRIRAASRLHFGLLSLPPGELSPGARPAESADALPTRHFGGVGLMVQDPGIRVAAQEAPSWSASGPLAERALAYAGRCAAALAAEGAGAAPPPLHLLVESTAPEHAGLGTGTQLGLAVAQALAAACGLTRCAAADLARWAGRGARSALGVHGFARGGLLVEAGKTSPEALAPLVARVNFPEEWPIVLVLPGEAQGLHGLGETQAFARLAADGLPQARTDRLCRLVLLGLLPTLAERDLTAFGEALFEFNRLVGEAFRPAQGGVYAHRRSAEIVAFLRRQGIRGVGQSSWGPALFAVTPDLERTAALAQDLRRHFGLPPGEVLVTGAANSGATVCVDATP
jgi:beta-RFAP synthase